MCTIVLQHLMGRTAPDHSVRRHDFRLSETSQHRGIFMCYGSPIIQILLLVLQVTKDSFTLCGCVLID